MQLRKATEVLLLILLTVLTSCQSPQYELVERCDVIASLDICRCSDYDFNIPEKVNEPYDMPVSYCQELKVTFSFEEWQNKIVPTRKAKKYLEDSTSKKDFRKRSRKINK